MLSLLSPIAALVVATSADALHPTAMPAIASTPDFAALATTTLVFAPGIVDINSSLDASTLAAIDAIQDSSATALPANESASAATRETDASESSSHDNRFFHRDSWRWNIQLALASDFGDETLGIAGFGVSYFLDTDFTIDFELNGLYANQSHGDDTGGLNLALLLRWHFWISHDQRWSIYADAGAGILFTGNDVPPSGSSFNFTPQAGMGFSMLLDEHCDARLLAGMRWYHVSNANTYEDNPGLNTLMVYAGVNFPF